MTTKHTGGPAFPTMRVNSIGKVVPDEEGITVRDYFAGKALQGMLARPGATGKSDAHFAYVMADYMLEARDK